MVNEDKEKDRLEILNNSLNDKIKEVKELDVKLKKMKNELENIRMDVEYESKLKLYNEDHVLTALDFLLDFATKSLYSKFWYIYNKHKNSKKLKENDIDNIKTILDHGKGTSYMTITKPFSFLTNFHDSDFFSFKKSWKNKNMNCGMCSKEYLYETRATLYIKNNKYNEDKYNEDKYKTIRRDLWLKDIIIKYQNYKLDIENSVDELDQIQDIIKGEIQKLLGKSDNVKESIRIINKLTNVGYAINRIKQRIEKPSDVMNYYMNNIDTFLCDDCALKKGIIHDRILSYFKLSNEDYNAFEKIFNGLKLKIN